MKLSSCSVLAGYAALAAAQFPPARENITWVKSPHHKGITISYKQTDICETTPGVKSYSGYIHLPPHSINETGESQDYPINTFFWFIESRKDPHNAPLSIWLNGGPGGSSLLGMLAENGPCFVNADSNSTTLNPYSWNNEVNMLYIDQPVQVGFSYDRLYNGTLDILKSLEESNNEDDSDDEDPAIKLGEFVDGIVPEQNTTFYVGTFASQNRSSTANSTAHGAVAMWHFAQTWFEEFPEYKPNDERISLWAESYGGHYGPAIFDYFSRQNQLIANGSLSGPGLHYIHLDTLGIVNGLLDSLVQIESYAIFAYNNTYGVQAVNASTHRQQVHDIHRTGGVKDQLKECGRLTRALEAGDESLDDDFVTGVCRNATQFASNVTVTPYILSGKYGWFDITHPGNDPFPANYEIGFLNQHWVQKSLGVPVNFTWASEAVAAAFESTGDEARPGFIEDVERLLDSGVKVAMMYGDRDFACNWIGGEMASLAIKHKYHKEFAAAGYEALVLNDEPPFVPYGLTRQHGNLSFTRVFQSGHMVPSYQPETSLRIFERSLFNRDIATGTVDIANILGKDGDKTMYTSKGPSDTFWRKNELMPLPEPECYLPNPTGCTQEEKDAIINGTAIFKDWILVGIEDAGEVEGVLAEKGNGQVVMEEL